MTQATQSALSSARERFLAGLARRGEELRPLIASFSADPSARVPRAELQRRLHTLLASAQLFEESALVSTLQRLTSRLDAVGLGGEPWRTIDRELMLALLTQLGAQAQSAPLTAAEPAARHVEHARPGAPAQRPPSRPAPERGLPAGVLLTRVLLVCSRPHAASLRGVLDDAPVELLHAADPEQAIALLHSASPTCALLAVEFATLPDINLVRSLQSDPRSRLGGVYLLLPAGSSYDAEFVRQTGADGVLIEPMSWSTLEPFLDRAQEHRGRGGLRALGEHPEGTVEEIASHFAEEVRSGLLSALREETTERIRLPDARELTEAARSAVDRARAHLAGHGSARAPVSEPPAPEPSPEAMADAVRALSGRRVLVVDDDPAVLWFFSGLLREAGATVLAARDGREALELARRKRPQLVISDILMPKMDGFALCRELRRDVLLARVPVILLTWKDDQLVRTAGVDVDPSAYLRKEAGGAEALAALSAALAPRQQLTAAAQAAGELTGEVEALGVAALLECVAEARPNARLRIEDGSRLFEVDIRDGQRVSITKTAADGSFTRGERALAQLLGVKSGSYSVLSATGSLRSPLAEPLPRALLAAGKELSVLLDAVSNERLSQVALISFDEPLLAVWGEHMPAALRELVACFKAPDTSAQLLLERGQLQPAQLEQQLRELAAYGVITGVWDAQGADLLALARRQRSLGPVSSAGLPAPLRAALEPTPASRPAVEEPSRPAPEPTPAGLGEPPPQEVELASEPWQPPSAASEPPALRASSAPPPLPVPAPAPEPARVPATLVSLVSAIEPALSQLRGARRDALRLGLTLAALAALGYLGGRLLESPSRRGAGVVQPAPLAQAAPVGHETSVRSGTDPGLALGTVLPYIDTSRGVPVGNDEGLVIFEYHGSAAAPSLEIDRHPLQAPPLALALPASTHELRLQRGSEITLYSLVVRAGETRIISLP